MNIVIILNYNDSVTTIELIEKIRNFNNLDKIIIVDNDSPDESFKILSKLSSDKIDIIKTEGNNGYGSGNNYGILYAMKNYDINNILISNPDIMVEENSIEKIFSFLDNKENVGMVTGVVKNIDNKTISNFAWKLPSYWTIVLYSSKILTKIFRYTEVGSLYRKSILNSDNPILVDAVPGCFFAIKATTFKKINFFDETTFLFHEENIIAHKLKSQSFESYILPKEDIIHLESISINKSFSSSNKKRELNFDSSLIYLKKYLKVSGLAILFYKIIHDLLLVENLAIDKFVANRNKKIRAK